MQIKTDEEMLAKDPSNWLARRSLDSLKARVKGSRFRGKSKKHLQDHHEEPTDKHPLYKTFSDRYLHRALR